MPQSLQATPPNRSDAAFRYAQSRSDLGIRERFLRIEQELHQVAAAPIERVDSPSHQVLFFDAQHFVLSGSSCVSHIRCIILWRLYGALRRGTPADAPRLALGGRHQPRRQSVWLLQRVQVLDKAHEDPLE